ncbi:MAG: hypothetical protein J2P50_12290 [Hyphomicrobiaceae bacterium]|nr:hypothetical protein [Hyphomicrobiaceae bacterium]
MTRALSSAAPARLSSCLHEANNDTGRTAFCGPVVVSAITGYSVSKVEAEVQAFRNVAPGRPRTVKGTYPEEVAAALAHFGYSMALKQSYMHLPRKQRPSLWGNWMQRQRNPWVHYILALHVGKQGHWVVIKGVKVCDTYSDGTWAFVCDWPHRSKRIMEVYEVRRALGV